MKLVTFQETIGEYEGDKSLADSAIEYVYQLKKKEHLESFVNRFRAKASKAKQAQSKMKQLDKLDIRDDYVSEEYLGFRFPYKDCPSKSRSSGLKLDGSLAPNTVLR